MAVLESPEALPLRLWPFSCGQFAVLGDIGRRMVRIAGLNLHALRPTFRPGAGRCLAVRRAGARWRRGPAVD